MRTRRKLILIAITVSAWLAFSVCAHGQICAGSNLTYIVRDVKGVPIDIASEHFRYPVTMETSPSTLKWSFTGKDFVKSRGMNVPEAISKLNGKITTLQTSEMCVFKQPVKLELMLRGKTMNLTFLVPRLSEYDSRSFLVDSLPFQPGNFEINLPADPQGKPLFYPATGWKKVN